MVISTRLHLLKEKIYNNYSRNISFIKIIFEAFFEKIETIFEIYLKNNLLFAIITCFKLRLDFLKLKTNFKKINFSLFFFIIILMLGHFLKLEFYKLSNFELNFFTEFFIQTFFYFYSTSKFKRKINFNLLLLSLHIFFLFQTHKKFEYLINQDELSKGYILLLLFSPAICEIGDILLQYSLNNRVLASFIENFCIFFNNCLFIDTSSISSLNQKSFLILLLLIIIHLILKIFYNINIKERDLENAIHLESLVSSWSTLTFLTCYLEPSFILISTSFLAILTFFKVIDCFSKSSDDISKVDMYQKNLDKTKSVPNL